LLVVLAHVDAARWPGPAGWLYRNVPGNLAASAIAFAAGYVVAEIRHFRPSRQHRQTEIAHRATVLARLDAQDRALGIPYPPTKETPH
ncbi:hypothetical protein ACXYUI_29455, partial [Klebsiella pneumoniae]